MARVLWLHKSGINEEQQGGDILPLCDAAEISNRTTYSLWVATDVTTSRETGKHTGEKPLPFFFFFLTDLKCSAFFIQLKKLKGNNFTLMVVYLICHAELFNPVVKHDNMTLWLK